jgi:hypothetical protein
MENDRFVSEETARTASTHQPEPINESPQRSETHDAHRTTSLRSEKPTLQTPPLSSNDGSIPW